MITENEIREIERHLNAIDDRLEDCSCISAEDGQEAVAFSTYKLAKKLINRIYTCYSVKLKLENIRVNEIGNITMKWFNQTHTSKSFAAGKSGFIYLEVGKSKIICYSSCDYTLNGTNKPIRYGREAASLIRTIFNIFYQNK